MPKSQEISAPDGSPILTVHLSALFQRDAAGWRFADAHPFTPPAWQVAAPA